MVDLSNFPKGFCYNFMKKLLIVVNTPEFFISHWLSIAVRAKDKGLEVHIASGEGDGIKKIMEYGFFHHAIPLTRSGQNGFHEIKALVELYRLFRQLKPDVVHTISIKPVIYGGIVGRLASVPSMVATISGLGTVFIGEEGVRARVRRWLVTVLYRFSLNHSNLAVIFENPDDRETFLKSKVLESNRTHLISGAGVDLQEFDHVAEPSGIPVVVMASRLLRDKGVIEFVDAARLLKARGVRVIMRLVGSVDLENPTSITESEFRQWRNEKVVDLLGYREDIAIQYANANIVCLPSYREGLPRSLIEAAACGRAVVTTDVPGCRHAIEPDVTGILVPVKNSVALADAIQLLTESPRKRSRMGKAGRKLAEKSFSIDSIVDQYHGIYEELLTDD